MNELQAIYDSEINFSISTLWDGGFTWKLGDELNGFVAEGDSRTFQAAVCELVKAALKHFPLSGFARFHSTMRN